MNAPFQSFNGVDIFPTIHRKATRLAYGLIKNHPFFDGNKRIGVHVLLVILALNKIELKYTQEELSDTILAVASGKYSYYDLLSFVISHQL